MRTLVLFILFFVLYLWFVTFFDVTELLSLDVSWNPNDYFKLKRSNKKHNLTLVSGYYDLNRPDRSAAHYMKWLTITLSLPYPLVFFCNNEMKPFILERRKSMLHMTTVITNEHFPLEDTLTTVKDIIQSPQFQQWRHSVIAVDDLQYKVPSYIPLIFSKFVWLKHAIELNKYNTNYFYWIDAGLGRFFTKMSKQATQFSRPTVFDYLFPHKVTMQYIRNSSLPIKDGIIGSADGAFPAGLFGGWKTTLVNMSDMVLDFYYTRLLQQRVLDNEQIAMAFVYHRNPSMFHLLYHHTFKKGHCNYLCI